MCIVSSKATTKKSLKSKNKKFKKRKYAKDRKWNHMKCSFKITKGRKEWKTKTEKIKVTNRIQ